MASEALRVLAVAARADATPQRRAEREMTFLGLVGMIDPPRPEAKAAVQTCEQAGIRVVMITGDHPLTAQAVARELGLLKTGRVVTGGRTGGDERRRVRARRGAHRGLCPRLARAQAARGHRAAEARATSSR